MFKTHKIDINANLQYSDVLQYIIHKLSLLSALSYSAL
jgi:hypothetical protein